METICRHARIWQARVKPFLLFQRSFSPSTIRRVANGIEYRPMASKDRPAVRELLYDHYFPENPPSKILGMNPRYDCRNFVSRLFSIVSNDLSVVVVDRLRGSQIIGCCLQTVVYKTDEYQQKFEPLKNPTEKEEIMHFFQDSYLKEQMFANVNIFDMYRVDRYIRMRQATVHQSYTENGILTEMVRKTCDLSKQHGISCLVGTTTHPASIKVLQKEGFDILYRAPYKNFVFKNRRFFGESNEASYLMGLKIPSAT